MNDIVNTFLLAGDKFMAEMHLKEPGSTYSACRPFTSNKERTEKCMQAGDTNYIYSNEVVTNRANLIVKKNKKYSFISGDLEYDSESESD